MALRYGRVLGWIGAVWIGVVFAPAVEAQMIGTPIAAHPSRSIAVGLEGSIIQRELVLGTGQSPDISMSKILLRGTYGLPYQTNVFLTLGTVDDDFRVINYGGTDLSFLADQAMAYGGGFKLNVYEISNFLLGAGVQYERFTLASGRTTSQTPSADAELAWQELRLFVGGQVKDIPYFVPYGGLYFSMVRGDLSFSRSTTPIPAATDVEESQSIGLFYGADFKWKKVAVGAELHMITENSVVFSVAYTF